MATIKELRAGLSGTTMPAEFADAMLKSASALWLSSDSAQDLAGDLALCYPALKRSEVRARAVAHEDTWRLTVVAHDRKGLLADTAAILSLGGFSIRSASIATWDHVDLALFAITVDGAEPTTEQLDAIGVSLKAAAKGNRPSVPFAPTGRAYVRRTGVANGEDMISVVAPDQAGLLATVCAWFSAEGASIEAAWINGERDEANDVFVIEGDVDCGKLEAMLTLENHSIEAVVGSMFEDARRAGETLMRNAADFLAGLLRRD
jgi:UTP:GlnB (protein PII) uridylyltransferase